VGLYALPVAFVLAIRNTGRFLTVEQKREPRITSHGGVMLTNIIRKECTEMWRDGRFRWSSAVIGGLLAVALASGYTAHKAARAERDSAQSQMEAWWYNQPAKNAHSAAHYGLWAFKPTPALAFADRGVDPYTGSATWLEAHRQNDFRFRPAMDASAAQRFGDWTTGAILQQLIPLLIIVLAFSAFAGEREQGTLRQLASVGVLTRTLVLGKSIGVATALSVVLVPAAVLGSAALLMGAGGDSGDIGRFAMLVLVYLAWFGVVLATTVAVSFVAKTAQRALLIMLGLWTLNSMVAPRAAAALGRSLHPTISRVDFINAVDKGLASGIDGHEPAGDRRKALEDELLKKYNVTSTKELPENFEALAMQASEVHGDEVFDHNFNAVNDQFRRQVNVQQAAAFVTPLLSVRFLSMAIAGTDLESHRAFAIAAETHRRLIQERMNGWLARNTKEGQTFSVRADSTLWKEVPAFTYNMPSLRATLAPYAVGAAALMLWLIASVSWVISRKRLQVA